MAARPRQVLLGYLGVHGIAEMVVIATFAGVSVAISVTQLAKEPGVSADAEE